MLTGKCQETVVLLLNEKDFNVRLTVATNVATKSRFTQKSAVEGIWKEYIRDSVGKIINTNEEYFLDMFIVKDGKIEKIEGEFTGKQIGNMLSNQNVLEADGIRITVTQPNGKQLSWIIVKP